MQNFVNQVVVFNQDILDMESYAEPGMRARIIDVKEINTFSKDLREHVYRITFDFSEYDTFNRFFETANYYGNNGVANKTAREAGYYHHKDSIYFGSPELEPFDKYFTFADSNTKLLQKKFEESGEDSYVHWLEKQVLEVSHE